MAQSEKVNGHLFLYESTNSQTMNIGLSMAN